MAIWQQSNDNKSESNHSYIVVYVGDSQKSNINEQSKREKETKVWDHKYDNYVRDLLFVYMLLHLYT